MGLSGDKGAFVASEVNSQSRDFLGCRNAAHGLARDELLAGFFVSADLFAKSLEAIFERGALNGAGADAVAADALGDEVDGDRFRQPDNGGLCGSVDETIGGADDRRSGRGHIDDRAIAAFEHTGKSRLDCAEHGLDVQIKSEVPVFVRGVQNRAMMDETRAVEQNIGLRVCHSGFDAVGVTGIGQSGFYVCVIRGRELFEGGLADVGGDHVGTRVSHGDCAGATDTLTRGDDEGAFARKPFRFHAFLPCG